MGIDLGNGLQAFGGVALQAQQRSVNAGLIRSADGDSRCREAHFLELHRQLGDDRVLGRYIEVAALLIVACPPIDCAGLVERRKRPAQSHTQHQGLCCAWPCLAKYSWLDSCQYPTEIHAAATIPEADIGYDECQIVAFSKTWQQIH